MVRSLVRRLLGGKGEEPAAGPGLSVLAHEADYTVLDLEMTGLDPARDSIVSVGAVRMRGAGILLGRTYEALVRPQTRMKRESVVIHEITPDDAEQGRPVAEVLPEFLVFCQDSVLVGWKVAMDHAFLSREARRQGLGLPGRFLDVAELCRSLRAWPGGGPEALRGLPDCDLDLFDLASRLGIEVRVVHNALSDAYITAQVFQRLLSYAGRGHLLGGLLAAGDPFSVRGGADHRASYSF